MWVQAATTMSIYQAVSNVAADSVPATSPAPPLLKADTSDAADPAQLTALASATDAGNQLNLADLVSQLLQAYINYVEQLYAPIIDFLQDPVGNGMQLITDFLTNPSQALVAWGPFLFAVAYQAFSWVGASLTYPQLILDPLLGTILRVVIGVGEQLLVQVPAAAAAGDLAGGAGVRGASRVPGGLAGGGCGFERDRSGRRAGCLGSGECRHCARCTGGSGGGDLCRGRLRP
ncbi:hypothetical protein NIIDMKKI_76190 [Mycobacterium kansasii]|uniref:PPE family protein n=1 Tax=Mycobacterium kansasii TaxID=1768 RepID=A0A7G1IRS6_MYCKA|nr:hypothetical protein NIIDMKKI_76190 [Mycobacterium kansasii]